MNTDALPGGHPPLGAYRLGNLPLLDVALRPFFLLGAAWAVLALGLWLAALAGLVAVGGLYGPLVWHGHEMTYGFAGAIVAGFLLTAVPNWTGRTGLAGTGLAAMALLWLAARLAMTEAEIWGAGLATALDLIFFATLLALTLGQIVRGRSWRNLPIALAPLALLTGSALVHLQALGLAQTADLGNRAGIAVFVLLVVLIGGRVIPAFTRNWLKSTKADGPLPVAPDRFDAATILATLLTLVLWLSAAGPGTLAVAAAATALLQAARLSRWCGWRTTSEPLVLVLHLAYAWAPIGFALLALSAAWPAVVPESAALHALTAGLMTTMMLAMMTRATLGHTGRPLKADAMTVLIYVLAFSAAISRIAASFAPDLFLPLIAGSGALWIAAFGLYLVGYGPKLCKRRVDGAG